MSTAQSSAPVARSMATTGEPWGSLPKAVCRTMNARSPSITGCQAISDVRPPDQTGALAEIGPSSSDSPLRAGVPPALRQLSRQAPSNGAKGAPADAAEVATSGRPGAFAATPIRTAVVPGGTTAGAALFTSAAA